MAKAAMMGQGVTMQGHDAMADTLDAGATKRELDEIEKSIRFLIQHMPEHADFLNTYCPAAPIR